jgi:hypothetical protein
MRQEDHRGDTVSDLSSELEHDMKMMGEVRRLKSDGFTSLRLPSAVIAELRLIGEQTGVGYQTAMKRLIYEGIVRERKRLRTKPKNQQAGRDNLR